MRGTLRNFSHKDFREIEKTRYGLLNSFQYCCHARTSVSKSLSLSEISLDSHGSSSFVTAADLEKIENQYIVAGKSSGGIAIYDTLRNAEELEKQDSSLHNRERNKKKYALISLVSSGSRSAHVGSVSSIQWYPVDTGFFCSSGSDKRVKVWDANTLKKCEDFKFGFQIYSHHMSPIAGNHSLIAVAGEKGEVILCDLSGGSSTHRMHGHEGPVQVVQWSRHNQYILASGGRDKTIRLWDVRSSKSCLKILDSQNSSESSLRLKKRAKKTPLSHANRITSLSFSNDGLWLLSLDLSGVMRLWNSNSGQHMDVDYGHISTDIKKPILMALSWQTYPDLVYVPSKSKILIFEISSGRLINVLEAHLDSILGLIYNPRLNHLYSYGYDKNFLTWAPDDLLSVKFDSLASPSHDNLDLRHSQNDDLRNLSNTHNGENSSLLLQDAWSSDEG